MEEGGNLDEGRARPLDEWGNLDERGVVSPNEGRNLDKRYSIVETRLLVQGRVTNKLATRNKTWSVCW